MRVHKTEKMKIPAKLWAKDIEKSALAQIEEVCKLPYVFHHMANMPDCHTGFSCPIGSVIATNNVVVPFFVGVDIGCGMLAVKTSLNDLTQEQVKKIFGGSKEFKGGIRGNVPVGFNHHTKAQDESTLPLGSYGYGTKFGVAGREYESSLKQIGSLGGGNHFLELQKGSDGHIWFMIHSGSRNLGYKVAKHYNKVAQDLCKKWYSDIPAYKGEDGLAFLPLDSEEGENYMAEMNYCLKFALANRKLMMDRVKEAIDDVFPTCVYYPEINIHHNYARLENHFGQNVMVHRKGATSAYEGQIGIIPGSSGTKSYIVRGLGNIDSFKSCSHGAGRKMSRTQAKKELNLEEEVKKMEDQGIIHSIRGKSGLDEASGAYKDIAVVMEEQKDLVEIIVELTPLGVIKG